MTSRTRQFLKESYMPLQLSFAFQPSAEQSTAHYTKKNTKIKVQNFYIKLNKYLFWNLQFFNEIKKSYKNNGTFLLDLVRWKLKLNNSCCYLKHIFQIYILHFKLMYIHHKLKKITVKSKQDPQCRHAYSVKRSIYKC